MLEIIDDFRIYIRSECLCSRFIPEYMLAKAENDAERTFLIDNFLRSNRTNELANVLKHMVIGDMESINTTYPKAILGLLRNASQDIKSSGSKKTLLAFLKHHILKYKKEQEANHNHEQTVRSKLKSQTKKALY